MPELRVSSSLEEYIRPEGGGYFFALPGVASANGHLGQAMFGA